MEDDPGATVRLGREHTTQREQYIQLQSIIEVTSYITIFTLGCWSFE